jgi:hypothetical protein
MNKLVDKVEKVCYDSEYGYAGFFGFFSIERVWFFSVCPIFCVGDFLRSVGFPIIALLFLT